MAGIHHVCAAYVSVYPAICQSICPSVLPSIRPSVCLPACLPTCRATIYFFWGGGALLSVEHGAVCLSARAQQSDGDAPPLVTLRDSAFRNNSALSPRVSGSPGLGLGGALYCNEGAGSYAVQNTTFLGNSACERPAAPHPMQSSVRLCQFMRNSTCESPSVCS
jgi:hypothetical protein